MISLQNYCVANTVNSVSYNITKKSIKIDAKRIIPNTKKIEDYQIIKNNHNSKKK